jgi:hypothetical protein
MATNSHDLKEIIPSLPQVIDGAMTQIMKGKISYSGPFTGRTKRFFNVING